MPGPVSDSYDPEFGTGENAALVAEAISSVRDLISAAIGDDRLQYIVAVAKSKDSSYKSVQLSERQLRLIRFALNRSLETI